MPPQSPASRWIVREVLACSPGDDFYIQTNKTQACAVLECESPRDPLSPQVCPIPGSWLAIPAGLSQS